MIPTKRLIALTIALGGVGLLVALLPEVSLAWLAAAALVGVVTLGDAVLGILSKAPDVLRQAPKSMSLVTWTEIVLSIRNDRSGRSLRLQLFDHHPETFVTRNLPLSVRVPPNQFADVAYQVYPTLRGAMNFTGCELRIASPLGLWWRRRLLPTRSLVRVYPNYSTISKLLAYEVDNRLQLTGVRLSRRRGEGIEFHQLRDYREGDSLRSIDWKATARMGRLIAREYQDERDQQVVFMLDAGRRMLAKDASLSHFDHTLNAMLLLSYVALTAGRCGRGDDDRREPDLAAAAQGCGRDKRPAQSRVRDSA